MTWLTYSDLWIVLVMTMAVLLWPIVVLLEFFGNRRSARSAEQSRARQSAATVLKMDRGTRGDPKPPPETA